MTYKCTLIAFEVIAFIEMILLVKPWLKFLTEIQSYFRRVEID